MHQDGELSALDIDLQEIDVVDLGKIVEALGLDPGLTDDAGIVLEEAEDLERGGTGNECARPTGIGTEVESVFFAVAHRIGEIGLVGPLLQIQLGEGRGLGFEAGDATQLRVQKRSVRRRALDWICANIHDMSQTAHAQEMRHIMSGRHRRRWEDHGRPPSNSPMTGASRTRMSMFGLRGKAARIGSIERSARLARGLRAIAGL